jgi:hypothetical protein
MSSNTLLLIASLLSISANCAFILVPGQLEAHTAFSRRNLSLFVVSEPPKSTTAVTRADVEDDGDVPSSNLQPIRRLRRDKKEPLIAIVGRPNVVS